MFAHLTPQKLFSLEGKVVLITGGAGGIAAGLSAGFAAAGARLVLTDRNESVERRAADLRAAGADVTTEILDVTDAERTQAAIAAIAERAGGLDVVVNNAAIIVRKHFLDLTIEEWRRVIDVDINACFTVAQAAARIMVKQGSGRIINMGSIMGHVSRPILTPYVTAKNAIHGFTRALAADLAATGVTVNALAPGYTITEFSEAGKKDFHDFVADWIPLKRWGKPEDLCGAALLLASAAGAYVNGQVLYVDGGFLAVTK
ncbi:MAG: SDR family oxidoreductase [Hyphomicrobiales bacterium]|nr:SDR family oxidoreductase [Hyphomicrobiales bacterium]